MIILFTNKDKDPKTPPNVENYFDLCYEWVENNFPNIKVVLPIKKKRNVELTQKEKTYDKNIVND